MFCLRSAAVYLLTAILTAFGAAEEHVAYQVGPQPDGSFVTPTNQVVTPAGTQVNFNGRPVSVVVRPDQKTAAVLVLKVAVIHYPPYPLSSSI